MRINLFVILCLLASCGVPKDVVYFQGIDQLSEKQLEEINQTASIKISPNDLLTIAVTSKDPIAAIPFNPPAFAYSTSAEGERRVESSIELFSYSVDKDGYINFPVLGKVLAAGYNRGEFSDYLQKEISRYIKDPIVKVEIVNFKITFLGDVARPGPITVRNDRISILDALGQVGDVNINARRDNVLLIREINGQKEFARIDLTDPALFASPYYYLRQNDVIYVEPNDAKKKNSRYSQAQQYNITVFSSVMSALSIITTMVITIINNTK